MICIDLKTSQAKRANQHPNRLWLVPALTITSLFDYGSIRTVAKNIIILYNIKIHKYNVSISISN